MEAMIAQFCTFKDDQSVQSKVSFTQSNATNSQVFSLGINRELNKLYC